MNSESKISNSWPTKEAIKILWLLSPTVLQFILKVKSSMTTIFRSIDYNKQPISHRFLNNQWIPQKDWATEEELIKKTWLTRSTKSSLWRQYRGKQCFWTKLRKKRPKKRRSRSRHGSTRRELGNDCYFCFHDGFDWKINIICQNEGITGREHSTPNIVSNYQGLILFIG